MRAHQDGVHILDCAVGIAVTLLDAYLVRENEDCLDTEIHGGERERFERIDRIGSLVVEDVIGSGFEGSCCERQGGHTGCSCGTPCCQRARRVQRRSRRRNHGWGVGRRSGKSQRIPSGTSYIAPNDAEGVCPEGLEKQCREQVVVDWGWSVLKSLVGRREGGRARWSVRQTTWRLE